jgi:hypothetical protein
MALGAMGAVKRGGFGSMGSVQKVSTSGGGATNNILLEDGTSKVLQEDGTSKVLKEP